MDVSNFFVDTQGTTCLVDCEDVALLPESFASYTMSLARQPFTVEVARYLGWPRSSNVSSMARIREILWTMGDPTLGMSTITWQRFLTNVRDRPRRRRLAGITILNMVPRYRLSSGCRVRQQWLVRLLPCLILLMRVPPRLLI